VDGSKRSRKVPKTCKQALLWTRVSLDLHVVNWRKKCLRAIRFKLMMPALGMQNRENALHPRVKLSSVLKVVLVITETYLVY
jgi:hypothetical protein